MTFLHLPSNRLIHNPPPHRARAYRRSANFVEVTESKPRPADVPEGTIVQVLSWVDNDPTRAQAALDHEQAGKVRTTLISSLHHIINK